jgi:hypothetical protein
MECCETESSMCDSVIERETNCDNAISYVATCNEVAARPVIAEL